MSNKCTLLTQDVIIIVFFALIFIAYIYSTFSAYVNLHLNEILLMLNKYDHKKDIRQNLKYRSNLNIKPLLTSYPFVLSKL